MNKVTAVSGVKLLDVFSDDHIPCAQIAFTDQGGITYEMELYCTGAEGVGACKYANDSESAKQDLIKLINEQIALDGDDE